MAAGRWTIASRHSMSFARRIGCPRAIIKSQSREQTIQGFPDITLANKALQVVSNFSTFIAENEVFLSKMNRSEFGLYLNMEYFGIDSIKDQKKLIVFRVECW
jgi:hypothetical protein